MKGGGCFFDFLLFLLFLLQNNIDICQSDNATKYTQILTTPKLQIL